MNHDLDYKGHICGVLCCVQWVIMRDRCSVCWYWLNCWPSLFELSFHNLNTEMNHRWLVLLLWIKWKKVRIYCQRGKRITNTITYPINLLLAVNTIKFIMQGIFHSPNTRLQRSYLWCSLVCSVSYYEG
jgi:hypothetical protein